MGANSTIRCITRTIRGPRSVLCRRVLLTAVYVFCILSLFRYEENQDNVTAKEPLDSALLRVIRRRGADLSDKCLANPPPQIKLEKSIVKAKDLPPLHEHFQNVYKKQVATDVVQINKANLSWCILPKVASTSFAEALVNLEKKPSRMELADMSPQVLLRKRQRSPDLTTLFESLNKSVTILFVRHPFERLVSAYRNKLEDMNREPDGDYFHKNYGRKIVMKYRPASSNGLEGLNSEEKLQFDYGYRMEPTFQEFIDYILDTNVEEYDEHWKPIWVQCHVCHVKYVYIVKYENFKEEVGTLISYLKDKGNLPREFKLAWENKGHTDHEMALQYMKGLPEALKSKLFEKFKLDFQYFNYTLSGFV